MNNVKNPNMPNTMNGKVDIEIKLNSLPRINSKTKEKRIPAKDIIQYIYCSDGSSFIHQL